MSALFAAPPLRLRRGRHPRRPIRRPPCDFVEDGVLQWSATEQMPLGYDVPSARQRRAVIPSQCSHWRGNPSPRRGDAHIRPPLFDKKTPAVYTRLKDAAMNGRRLVTAPKGGDIYVLDAYIPHRRLFSLDQNSEAEKTKPPLCQVTVSNS